MTTIRSRMVVIILGVIALCWLALIPLTQSQTRAQINALMDQRAEYMADTLLVILEGEAKEAGTAGLVPEASTLRGPVHHYESEPPFPFQMWIEDELRARTTSTPDFARPRLDTPTWRELHVDGEDWRVLTRQKAILSTQRGGLVNAWAVVGIRSSELNALADSLVWRSIWPVFVTLPILAIIVFVGIGVGLRPLRDLAEQVSKRSPRRLKPVVVEPVPGEVIPLVNALNHLFGEVQRAFANEKRFTADAAHELRTPLSALSAQAQVALQSDSELPREKALRQIVNGVDRLSHLVSQLLTLARIDPDIELKTQEVDLVTITTELMADVAPVAMQKDLDFELHADQSVVVQGDPALLTVMIRNLLENAVKYTPAKGEINVSIVERDEKPEIRIQDTGPGIPLEHRKQVFQRFFRLGESSEFGTGLGLSIAERVASLHNSAIDLIEPKGAGLIVVVTFPSS